MPAWNIITYANRLTEGKKQVHFFVIIGVGSNLFGPDSASSLTVCERAVRAIADLPDISCVTRSRWFSSAPVPPSDQPRYVNGALRAAWAGSPEQLLGELQRIELASGRSRSVPNAARTLDLDIVDAGGTIRTDAALTLPHPRAHLRGFVLRPLRDVAPHWIHPVSGRSVAELLAGLPPDDTAQL